jgi:hypothetical protein
MRSKEFMCRDFGDRSDVEIESNLGSVNEIEHRFQRRKVDAENFTNQ